MDRMSVLVLPVDVDKSYVLVVEKTCILKDYHTKEILFAYAINNYTSFQSFLQ